MIKGLEITNLGIKMRIKDFGFWIRYSRLRLGTKNLG